MPQTTRVAKPRVVRRRGCGEFYGGIRAEEIQNVRRGNVVGDQGLIGFVSKGGKQRSVALPPQAQKIISEYATSNVLRARSSGAYRRADPAISRRAKLPEVADEPLPLVDAPEAKLHGHLESHRGGIAVGELTIEAAAAFQIGRHHHGRRIGTGHEVVLGEGEDLPAPGDLVVGERLRGALPAQVPPWIGDRAAVLALLAVEPKVLLLFAHGGGHAREGARDRK